MRREIRAGLALAAVALFAFCGAAGAASPEEDHFDALASELANASNIQIDLEPLLEGK